MTLSPLRSSPLPKPTQLRPVWSQMLSTPARGLALAREQGVMLAWDEENWLYLVNHAGDHHGRRHIPSPVTAACAADDGSAFAAAAGSGAVAWLAPDLRPRWEQTLPARVVAVALDPFGQYLAAADAAGGLHLFDRHGRSLTPAQLPRPLHHLAFVPAAPSLVGASDYGLVVALDLKGQLLWRDGLVAHIGSLAVSGDGARIILACFTDGLQEYSLLRKKQERQPLPEPCRFAALSFDGQRTLVVGLSRRLHLVDRTGLLLTSQTVNGPPVAVVLAALADRAIVALQDGTLLGIDIIEAPSAPTESPR